jgi:hypothetical protein
VYATWRASLALVSSATAFFSAEQESEDKFRRTENNSSEFQILTLGTLLLLLQLSPCSIHLLLERGQGGLLLFEGSLYVANGHLPRLEDDVLLYEELGKCRDGRLLALELSLLALELGLLLIEHLVFLLQRRRIPPQLGYLHLDLLGLPFGCGSLCVSLAAGLGELLLLHVVSRLQVGH